MAGLYARLFRTREWQIELLLDLPVVNFCRFCSKAITTNKTSCLFVFPVALLSPYYLRNRPHLHTTPQVLPPSLYTHTLINTCEVYIENLFIYLYFKNALNNICSSFSFPVRLVLAC